MLVLSLPPDYRRREILAFHGRDPSGAAERLEGEVLTKGLMVEGRAALLTVRLGEDAVAYDVDLAMDEGALRRMVDALLGLHIDPRPFEMAALDDPILGTAVGRQRGLRIAQAATPFEALTWAITGQQISLPFAITLRRRLIEAAGVRHASGLWCYPDPAAMARLDEDQLGAMQFSRAKAATLLRVARMAAEGELDFEALAALSADDALAALTRIKGIGPWTAHYTLMRGLGALDCSLHGDAAVKNALRRLCPDETIDERGAEALLARFVPYRSLASAHLWASLSTFSA